MAVPSEVAGLVKLIQSKFSQLTGVSVPPLPAKAVTPYVTVHQIIATELESLEGSSGLKRSLMQVNVWDKDYERAWSFRQGIKDQLNAFSGDCGNGRMIASVNQGAGFGAGDSELYDTVRLYHQLIARFLVWWEVALAYLFVDEFGGNTFAFAPPPSVSDAWTTGATQDDLVPDSARSLLDISNLSTYTGSFYLEANARVSGAGGRARIALFNLDDAPGTPLSGSVIVFPTDDTVGTRVRSSAITMPSGAKTLGVKITINSTTVQAAGWGCRLLKA